MSMIPTTRALQSAMGEGIDPGMIEDLVFLECWERAPQPGSAAAMRISQIRRAHPLLARAIRAELAGAQRIVADRSG